MISYFRIEKFIIFGQTKYIIFVRVTLSFFSNNISILKTNFFGVP